MKAKIPTVNRHGLSNIESTPQSSKMHLYFISHPLPSSQLELKQAIKIIKIHIQIHIKIHSHPHITDMPQYVSTQEKRVVESEWSQSAIFGFNLECFSERDGYYMCKIAACDYNALR